MSTDLYREVRGAGPVLLLIPSSNGDAGFYEPFAKALSGDFTVISYDRRGFSRSFRTGPPSRWQICSARRSSIFPAAISGTGTSQASSPVSYADFWRRNDRGR